jgi:hypothetical protein
VKEKLNKTTPDADEDEVVQVRHNQVQNSLSKPIIRPWEEIIYNKNRT